MRHPNRSAKPRWTSTLLSLCLFTATVGGSLGAPSSSYAQSTPPLSAEQTAALAEAKRLNDQIMQLYQQGKFTEAIPIAKKALAIRQRILGENHPDVASSLNNLAYLYQNQGRYAEAEPLYKQALALYKRTLGENHSDVSTSLRNLAELYRSQGRYAEAEPLYKQALEVKRRILGENHPDVASSLNDLAFLYDNQGRYAEAEPLYKQALALFKLAPSEYQPYVALTITILANMYKAQGRFEDAETLLKEALALRKAALGDRHPDVATSLEYLAFLYERQGRFKDAETLLKEALAMRKAISGDRHPDIVDSLENLANLYIIQARYGDAETLLKEALAMRKAISGDRHPDIVNSLVNLADLYVTQGRYRDAEALSQEALTLRRSIGDAPVNIAINITQLAKIYASEKRYKDAENLLKEALALRKATLGDRHPDVVDSLGNLALLYLSQERYEDAEPLLKKVLALRKTILGDRHPDVIADLSHLAWLYAYQRRDYDAEPLYREALALSKAIADRRSVAGSLDNLAGLYAREGHYKESESLHQQALVLSKAIFGDYHPAIASSLERLAELYEYQGRYSDTIAFFKQALNIEEKNLTVNLAIGAEGQKQAYLAGIAATMDRAVSLHLQSAFNNSNAAHLALTTIFQRKGRILDALVDNFNRLRQNLTSADQQKLEQLSATHTQLAALYYGGLGKLTPEQYKDRITQLQQQITQLEADLNNRSTEFRSANQPITLEGIQNQIPADTALIELIRYRPFNLKAKPVDRYGKPRYAAYILSPQGTIQAIDLGETKPIDQLAARFRLLLQDSHYDPKPIARQLDAALMQPIRQKLGNTHKLLLSPDSALNLIPFAALVDEHNRYLLETTDISYLTSGRDLLRLQSPASSSQASVLIANPDYDHSGDPNAAQRVRTATTGNSGNLVSAIASKRRSADLTNLKFSPLEGTAAEAKAIVSKLTNPLLLTGSQATKAALQQVQSPRILHIATHGFFLQDVPQSTPQSSRSFRAGAGPYLEPSALPSFPSLGENPLLRSGLALAGANLKQNGSEDGILTALEAANLNLRGTQLVVLSACETGLGDVANGEGVYGLRRAFTLAGAETELMSLWKVDDAGTKDLMVQYYDRLLNGTGRSDALLQTQRALLSNPQYHHPYYWASFILSGDWRSLRSK